MTANYHSGSSKMSVNLADYLAFPFYAIVCAVSLGLLSSTFFGFDLATTYDLGGGHGFSLANIVAIVLLGYVAYTNDWEGDIVWTAIQGWIVLATIALLISPPFLPPLEATLAADPAAAVAWVVQMGGFMAFSYYG